MLFLLQDKTLKSNFLTRLLSINCWLTTLVQMNPNALKCLHLQFTLSDICITLNSLTFSTRSRIFQQGLILHCDFILYVSKKNSKIKSCLQIQKGRIGFNFPRPAFGCKLKKTNIFCLILPQFYCFFFLFWLFCVKNVEKGNSQTINILVLNKGTSSFTVTRDVPEGDQLNYTIKVTVTFQ